MHTDMWVCEYMRMREGENACMRVCKYANIRVCEYSSMRVCKYASMQVCKYTSMSVWKYANMKYTSMQVCKDDLKKQSRSIVVININFHSGIYEFFNMLLYVVPRHLINHRVLPFILHIVTIQSDNRFPTYMQNHFENWIL